MGTYKPSQLAVFGAKLPGVIRRQASVRPRDCTEEETSLAKAQATADILELLAIEVEHMASDDLADLARAAKYDPSAPVGLSGAGTHFLSCLGYENPPLREPAKILAELTRIEWLEQGKAAGFSI